MNKKNLVWLGVAGVGLYIAYYGYMNPDAFTFVMEQTDTTSSWLSLQYAVIAGGLVTTYVAVRNIFKKGKT